MEAMTSMALGFVTGFFTYETTKSVVVKSWSVGIINRIVQLLIITYFVGWVFIHEKAYQVIDTGIESSVMTKVKGFGHLNHQVMDVADYVYPPQGSGIFCIMTRIIVTEDQFQGRCAEVRTLYWIEFKTKSSMCQTTPNCPDSTTLDVLNFTIFIKNSIRFPLFNVTRGNIPSSMTSKMIKNCFYHPEHNSSCPIFRVGDVLNYTGQDLTSLTMKGGEIGINIEWKCNFDRDIELCVPKYSFTRLDAPFMKNQVSKGYNFRFAKYYKTENGTEFRTLHKAFAIRFDVMVTGNAGKFSTIPTLINLVAAFTSIGLGTVICDIILLNFLKGAKQYKAKKFEEVSESQIETSPSSESKPSLKEGMKSSGDSGAISLSISD
uniref:P2X purinoceptor n=1 Tax=Oryzias sinensis TaxID=183150 RepID=A0A8C7YIE1_9TELE